MPTNIAEGCGRDGAAELARFLQIAKGSASQSEYLLLLAHDLGLLPHDSHAKLAADVVEVRKMLSGLLKRLYVSQP